MIDLYKNIYVKIISWKKFLKLQSYQHIFAIFKCQHKVTKKNIKTNTPAKKLKDSNYDIIWFYFLWFFFVILWLSLQNDKKIGRKTNKML